jgi:hypothetical protein
MTNVAPLNKQLNEDNLTELVKANPYKSFRFLGREYSSLRELCIAKNKPYMTVKNRLNAGMSLADAISQPKHSKDAEIDFKIRRLYLDGSFDTAEISLLTGQPVSKVNATIQKLKQVLPQ